jgi:hypothetical protein
MALQACAVGTPVDYLEEDNDDHLLAATVWADNVQSWVTNVPGGGTAPNTCSSIAPGNSLAAEQAP